MEIKLLNDTKTIEPSTTEPSKPYLAQKVAGGTEYYPCEISSGEGVAIKGNGVSYRVMEEPTALKFSSDGAFTLSVSSPNWDGTIEYSTDKCATWSTWDGSQLSGTATQPIYLRGTGNTVITGNSGTAWTFTGKYCTGNIETLLDYQTVKQGNHPTMGAYCFYVMFESCNSIIIPPEFPAITLSESCYRSMFNNCVRLQSVPSLPATTLATYCYTNMFRLCPQLTVLPLLLAQNLSDACYMQMFSGCDNIKLSTTQTGEYQYEYRIPTTGTGTVGSYSLNNMFKDTGGTFTGTPTINTIYYTDHQPV